jgi:peroxiredoxin Q/BCP
MLSEGTTFPAFELTAHDGTRVSNADLAGRPYLVYFYPKADTPGCTREACELRDCWPELEAAGLQVLGVSYDSPAANRAFAARRDLPFLLLSDRDRSLARSAGAKQLLLPLPRRISYLVGADGRVLKAYPRVSPSQHARQVLADFLRLQRGSGNGDQGQ